VRFANHPLDANPEVVEFLNGNAEAFHGHGQVFGQSSQRVQGDHVRGAWRHRVLLVLQDD
jgi:hypothetical protein